ncbi:Aspartic proteinase Asp1 [Quillaja saponaria]|uniref:Aspartic proteinase Asp1 n=1 Tax=Quillaja saponaria TaxID=32244 RepID=A0AAD7M483_QUISA|nr:Aspartic proteinase Asp1 [Quillaja saponaria]
MENDNCPQLKAVVIISLPPPDNPSLGKTITAFTISDSSPSEQSQQTHEAETNHNNQEVQDHHLPFQPNPPNPQLQFSFRNLSLSSPIKIFGLLGISFFALLLCGSVYTDTFRELRDSENDRELVSFLFPLFPKLSIRGQQDNELKLGRFTDVGTTQRSTGTNKLVALKAATVDSSSIFPVRGNIHPDGLYFTHVLVGSPPKRYFLDIDTGSDLTWIQCDAPCTSCAKGAHALYKPRENVVSSEDSLCMAVHKNIKVEYFERSQQCDYEIQYADHSSSLGVLVRDELHLQVSNGSATMSNFVFGCAYDQQGLLLNTLAKTDGIIGLSRAEVGLPSQLASKGTIKNVVGHCLSNHAVGGGYMFLGDDFVPSWGMAWVPMLNSPIVNSYHAKIHGINYGNSRHSLGGQSSKEGLVIFDSGSSYTYFTEEAYLDLVASIKEVSRLGFIEDVSDTTLPICWQASFPIRSVKDVNHFFKTLTLQFGSSWWIRSTKFQIPPEGYLIISPKGNVCLSILDGSNVHDGSSIILGDNLLRGYLVVYDNVNQKIGWRQSDCVMPGGMRKSPNFLLDTSI